MYNMPCIAGETQTDEWTENSNSPRRRDPSNSPQWWWCTGPSCRIPLASSSSSRTHRASTCKDIPARICWRPTCTTLRLTRSESGYLHFARRVWCASGSDSELITSCSPSQVLPLHVGGTPQMLQNRIAPKTLFWSHFPATKMEKHHDVSHQQRQNSHATCSQNTRRQARTVVQSFYCWWDTWMTTHVFGPQHELESSTKRKPFSFLHPFGQPLGRQSLDQFNSELLDGHISSLIGKSLLFPPNNSSAVDRVTCLFRHTDSVKIACVCALKSEAAQQLRKVCVKFQALNMVSRIRFMQGKQDADNITLACGTGASVQDKKKVASSRQSRVRSHASRDEILFHSLQNMI